MQGAADREIAQQRASAPMAAELDVLRAENAALQEAAQVAEEEYDALKKQSQQLAVDSAVMTTELQWHRSAGQSTP